MDESIFHRLYDTYHQDIFRFLMYVVKDRTAAEDMSHEVYVRVLRAYDRFEGKSSEKTWLFSIAKNVAIDHFRKMNVRKQHTFDAFDWEQQQLIADGKSPEQFAELNEELQQLLQALETCTGDQKMVIILRYIQELSVRETALVLDWTEAKVKTTQHRAIKALREKLTKQEAIANEGF